MCVSAVRRLDRCQLIKPNAHVAMSNAFYQRIGQGNHLAAGIDDDKVIAQPVHFHKGYILHHFFLHITPYTRMTEMNPEIVELFSFSGLTLTADVLNYAASGPVAQLVEQLTFNQWVTGSNPVGLTIYFKSLADKRWAF